MTIPSASGRHFLFLQGPAGPFFRLLGEALRDHGAIVHRINLSGGDRYDWREGATDFRGRPEQWPMYLDRFFRDQSVTDVVLFGDCRDMHRTAIGLANLRGIHIHVFEDGYIRPNWMTLETDGVNGHSPMERDPAAIRAAAKALPPLPELPPITAQFNRRARDNFWHYYHIAQGFFIRFPHYQSHRRISVPIDAIGWILRFARAGRRRRQAAETLDHIAGKRYFLFPLQLTHDFQIRAHSPFGSMPIAADYVLESFARHAPPGTMLVVKEHPLDGGYLNWRRFLAGRARRLGIADRVVHIDGGDLAALSRDSLGMVCINSTSGTLAVEVGTPVIVLGEAVYDVPGVTYGGTLDRFWSDPGQPDRDLYEAFKRVLHQRCLVRGGLASESAIQILVENSVPRLLAVGQGPGSSPASSR